jgi:hypothetical protein
MEARWILIMRAWKLWEVVTLDPEIIIGHGHSRWRYLGEQNPSMDLEIEKR